MKINKEMLRKYGINENFISAARKMNLDIVKIIKEKFIFSNDPSLNETAITTIMGIYGNYFATYYFSELYGKVENEVPIYDETGKEVTKADLKFVDSDGVINYCEVKMAFEIIDNMRNYVDKDDPTYKRCYVDKDEEIIKYKNIGKKLIRQVGILSSGNVQKVNVIIFDGCYVDDVIKDKLKDFGVRIITLEPKVAYLYDVIKDNMISLKNEVLKPKDIKDKNLMA